MNYQISLFGGPNKDLTAKAMCQLAAISPGPGSRLPRSATSTSSPTNSSLTSSTNSSPTICPSSASAKAFVDLDLQCEAVIAGFRHHLAAFRQHFRTLRANLKASLKEMNATLMKQRRQLLEMLLEGLSEGHRIYRLECELRERLTA